MKKILSLGILLVVILAFSGAASAAYTTNVGTRNTVCGPYHDSGNTYYTHTTEKYMTIHYTKKHVAFDYRMSEKNYAYDYWPMKGGLTIHYREDYRKIAYNKILITRNIVQDGKWLSYKNGGYYRYIMTTLHSPYYVSKKINRNNKPSEPT